MLDTNAVISLLQGNSSIEFKLSQAGWIGISVISVIEFFSFPRLTTADNQIFSTFLQRIETVPLLDDLKFLQKVSALKLRTRLKLPDAIIAQSAIEKNATLITNDKDFSKIPTLVIQYF